jgi:hypothetical protein
MGEGFDWVAVAVMEWVYLGAVVLLALLAGLVPRNEGLSDAGRDELGRRVDSTIFLEFMMRSFVCLIMLMGTAMAQTTQSAPPVTSAATEVRAKQAFSRGEYAIALPLLKKVAENLKDQPERLGQVNEQIRVCETNLAKLNPQAAEIAKSAPTDPQLAITPPASNDPPMSAEKRVPHPAPKAGEVAEMSIKQLGNFDYDAEHGGNIPDDIKKMNGATIKLRGFMIPMDQAERITQFALVPSLFACCFGQPPQIQHTIVVNCPKGKAVPYFPDELSVEGKLQVEEQKEDGFVVSVFELEATSVKPAAK